MPGARHGVPRVGKAHGMGPHGPIRVHLWQYRTTKAGHNSVLLPAGAEGSTPGGGAAYWGWIIPDLLLKFLTIGQIYIYPSFQKSNCALFV